ncbi:MAG: Maf family nucleotide pyrophosphatase [Gammaproteobacteria bacterium]|nr:Maf family nucleotide pyrophosphatase [Gammaproteobacteria bacterium]
MPSQPTLILASTSPRRREILAALDLEFMVNGVEIDERRLDSETAEDMVLRLASVKVAAVPVVHSDRVIGADTAVVLGNTILGKPLNRDEAVAMLLSLSGRRHRVLTGVALRGPDGVQTVLSETDVYFRAISQDEAHAYWQSGEPRDKAGAYGIQGLGGVFVERLDGSYSGVVGLPVFETVQLLQNAGIDVLVK